MEINRNPNDYFEMILKEGQIAQREQYENLSDTFSDTFTLEHAILDTETEACDHKNMIENMLTEARKNSNDPLVKFIQYYQRRFLNTPYYTIRGMVIHIKEYGNVRGADFITPWTAIYAKIDAFKKTMKDVFDIHIDQTENPPTLI